MRLMKSLLALSVLALPLACGGPAVEVDGEFLEVVHASPHHGAVDVEVDVLPLVGFTSALDRTQLDAIHLEQETPDGYVEVDARKVPRAEDRVVMVVPRELLETGLRYRLRVEPGVFAKNGHELLTEYSVEWSTAAGE